MSRQSDRQLTPTRARVIDEAYLALMNISPVSPAVSIPPKLETVSKQATKVTALSAKLEWRIEQFQRLMRLFKNGQNLISKQFGSPEATVVAWELHVYPNGKRDEDANNVSYFLRQVGLTRDEDPVLTEFQIYALDGMDQRVSICRDTKDFINQQGRGKFQVSREKMNSALQADGSLMLVCEVEYLPPGVKMHAETDRPSFIMHESKENRIRDANREMLENELFTDCVIQVDNKQIKAHKCVLGQHSEVFRMMFANEMMVEAKEGIIDIKDCKYEPMLAMINFIYANAFELDETCAEDVLQIADKYAVFPLKEKCEKHLASQLTLTNFLSTAVFADTYSAQLLKAACVRYFCENQRNIIKSPEWEEMKSTRPHLLIDIMELAFTVNASGSPYADSPSYEVADEYRPRKRARRSAVSPQ